MPGREAGGVEGEAGAACEWAAEGLSSGEDGGVLRAETDGLAEFDEMSGVKTASVK